MAGSKKNLKFEYDAFGRRIAKHVYNNETAMLEKSTYYILDAQGNQLSMYEHRIDTNSAKYYLTERNIYGSSRLGTTNDTINMFVPKILPSYGIMGNRTYELSNHLGNVLTIISDIKYPISSDNTTISGYEVGINGISDYSPFGAPLDGRTVGRLGKYGFNGQEMDDEIKGTRNFVNYTFRMHDVRLGRFFTLDPLRNNFIYLSPFAFAGNTPIKAIDLEGAEIMNAYYNYENGEKTTLKTGSDKTIADDIDRAISQFKEDDEALFKFINNNYKVDVSDERINRKGVSGADVIGTEQTIVETQESAKYNSAIEKYDSEHGKGSFKELYKTNFEEAKKIYDEFDKDDIDNISSNRILSSKITIDTKRIFDNKMEAYTNNNRNLLDVYPLGEVLKHEIGHFIFSILKELNILPKNQTSEDYAKKIQKTYDGDSETQTDIDKLLAE